MTFVVSEMPSSLLLLSIPLLTQPVAYTPDELIVLNGIGGFGDRGSIDVSRDVRSPDNKLGFSLKVIWEDHPGDPPWWSIRMGLPGDATGYDTLSFDLYVESVEGDARLTVFLYETDDDRWVCWQGPLGSVIRGQWQRIEVRRDEMRLWPIGNNEAQWERIHGLAIEPNSGKAVFYIDVPRLSGPAGVLDILSTDDDGLKPLPDWHEPLHDPGGPGALYFPFDCGRLDNEVMRDTPLKLAELLGPVGVPISGYGRNVLSIIRYYAQHRVPTVFYSSFGAGYMRYFTRRQAWDVNAHGRSLNSLPAARTNWDAKHTIALAHPAVRQAGRDKVDALVRAGFGAWMVVDYTFPWWETAWGYSQAMIEAYRRDLAGRDEGLHMRDGQEESVAHFPDYFRAYMGFYPQPEDLGVKTWAEFEPPRPGEEDETARRRWTVFLYLRSYEWLKLPDDVGRHYLSRGEEGLWVVPNPEDSNGSSDYVWMVRSVGVGNLFPEWFGPIGWAAEAFYSSGPYLREQATRGGTRLSMIQETGAGGHSAPYLDWRIAYAGVYAIAAAGQLDDFDNDFIDETDYETMADPARNEYQFRRFRDAIVKALAFLQARDEKPQRPGGAQALCVAARPPAHASSSIFFGVGQPWNLASGLSRAGLVFDTRDSFELEQVLPRYDMVFYSPYAPRVGDVELLRRWLEQKPGRVLVTHSFVPTRRADGYWNMDRGPSLGAPQGGKLLGLGPISYTDDKRCVITQAAGDWGENFALGSEFELPHPLTRCEGGQTLVGTDKGPLVSCFSCGRGEVVYLHYTSGAGILTSQLDAAVARALARAKALPTVCDADFGLMVQVFLVPGGYTVVAWDGSNMAKWPWRYEAGLAPMLYEAPEVSQSFRLRVALDGPWDIYNLLDNQRSETVARDGWVNLRLKGALCGLFYVTDRTTAGRAVASAAQRLRERMRQLHFDDAPTAAARGDVKP